MMKMTLPLLLIILLMSGCAEAVELSQCRNLADQFMSKLAKRDFAGASELCDPMAIDHDTLTRIANDEKNAPVLDDYQGLEHGDGGQKVEKDETVEVRLAPATPTGHEDYRVNFAFRKIDGEFKLIGFAIEKK